MFLKSWHFEHTICSQFREELSLYPSITNSQNTLPHYRDCKIDVYLKCSLQSAGVRIVPKIYTCLSCLTSLITSAMWLLCLVLHQVNLETRTWDIFNLHYINFLSLKKDNWVSNSVCPDMERVSVFKTF